MLETAYHAWWLSKQIEEYHRALALAYWGASVELFDIVSATEAESDEPNVVYDRHGCPWRLDLTKHFDGTPVQPLVVDPSQVVIVHSESVENNK